VIRTIVTPPRLTLLAATALCLLAIPATASAKAPCWKTLINDWYDGRIDNVYPVKCYRDALAHLPEDVETYSSARDDIRLALAARIQGNPRPPAGGTKNPVRTGTGSARPSGGSSGASTTSDGTGSTGGGTGSTGGGTGSTGGGTGSTGGTTKPSTGSSGGSQSSAGNPPGDNSSRSEGATTTGETTTPQQPGRAGGDGAIGRAIDEIGPNDADSVPIPLLVLAGVALLLLALGATGFIMRRMQGRRVDMGPPKGPPDP
jgi:hypothetical protein